MANTRKQPLDDADLLAENADLRQKLRYAEDTLTDLMEAGQGGETIVLRPEMFLALMAVVVLCRILLYVFIEKYGYRAPLEAMIADGVFGLGGLALFGMWCWNDAPLTKWLLVGKASLVLAVFIIAVDGLCDGIWSLEFRPGHSGLPSMISLVIVLLMLASGLFEKGMKHGIALLRRWR